MAASGGVPTISIRLTARTKDEELEAPQTACYPGSAHYQVELQAGGPAEASAGSSGRPDGFIQDRLAEQTPDGC